jgi:uncharacterized damage-inducible protein DinB
MDPGAAFLGAARTYLRDSYLPRLQSCVAAMSREDLWWRPNDASNSVANLLLHMAGNLQQWVVSGVGDEPDTRDRPAEFAARGDAEAAELLSGLASVVMAAAGVLDALEPSRLGEVVSIQGRELTRFDAVFHAVEHFAMHAGQVFYIAKQKAARGLGFYALRDGVPRPTWTGGVP